MNDGDRIAGEEKERKTEAEVNGQHQARLDMEWITVQRCARPGYLEASNPKHRPQIRVGKDADIKRNVRLMNCSAMLGWCVSSTGLLVCFTAEMCFTSARKTMSLLHNVTRTYHKFNLLAMQNYYELHNNIHNYYTLAMH